jgi:hypothetical protein
MSQKAESPNFLSEHAQGRCAAGTETAVPPPNPPTSPEPPCRTFNERRPADVQMLTVKQPDGRLSQYPPAEYWDDWVEWDGKAWPQKVARRYMLIPTVCFNCESACGLLAYVDKTTPGNQEVRGQPGPSRQPGAQLRQRPRHPQPDLRPRTHPLPAQTRRRARRRQVEAHHLGQALRRNRRKDARQPPEAQRRHHVPCRPAGRRRLHQPRISAWGVDGHNSHTNICSSGARAGLLPLGRVRPAQPRPHQRPRHFAHLQPPGNGPLLQPPRPAHHRGQDEGAKLITFDPRLSNTASLSDVWLPTWPGSESNRCCWPSPTTSSKTTCTTGILCAAGSTGRNARGSGRVIS